MRRRLDPVGTRSEVIMNERAPFLYKAVCRMTMLDRRGALDPVGVRIDAQPLRTLIRVDRVPRHDDQVPVIAGWLERNDGIRDSTFRQIEHNVAQFADTVAVSIEYWAADNTFSANDIKRRRWHRSHHVAGSERRRRVLRSN